ncbi:MAG TPA: SUMF1/EgtB/PvdO family nonheme iron enzyme, partial [Pirellulales bacterium]|nr:SUMF1/EgtB/PvdO family nonheme iron enzyme [Pirellulales bacterium]
LRGEPIMARRAGALERAWKWTRRNPLAVAVCLAIGLAFAGGAALFGGRNSESAPAPQPTAVPEVTTRPVLIETIPAGARGVMVPIDPETGAPDASRRIRFPGVTPLEVQAPPARYLVVVELPNHDFHEVSRTVPPLDESVPTIPIDTWSIADGKVALNRISIPSSAGLEQGMARFDGGVFRAGSDKVPGSPAHERTLEPFWLDVTEVTWGQFRSAISRNRIVPNKHGFHDDDAMAFLNFAHARAFAESIGKRLPSEFEYEFAATNGGTTWYPWGDDSDKIEPWQLGAVKGAAYDVTLGQPPVFGLYSNVTEWTDSLLVSPTPMPPPPASFKRMIALGRVVRGGPTEIANGEGDTETKTLRTDFGPRWRQGMFMVTHNRGIGFRCARSVKPRYLD